MRSELATLGRQLPGIYREAVQALQVPSVEAAMQHYADFVSHVATDAGRVPGELLPTLHAVTRADLTADEGPAESEDSSWTHQRALTGEGSREEASTGQSAAPPQPRGADTGVTAEISWDIDLAPAAAADADAGSSVMDQGIDWEVDVAPSSSAHPASGDTLEGAGLSDWDIDVEGAAVAEPSPRQDGASANGTGGVFTSRSHPHCVESCLRDRT